MDVSTLMAGITLIPEYNGVMVTDDYVLAINTGLPNADVGTYAVAGTNVTGFDPQLNPETADKTYIRVGKSTIKTASQRSFSVGGDRFIGDSFQDFCLSFAIKYGTGQKVVADYVYFNQITGKGEKGKASIIVNSDGSGEAANTAEIDIELKQAFVAPAEYTYTPA